MKGKEVRLLLINAFDTWLHIPAEKKEEIGVITQMLHNASLLSVEKHVQWRGRGRGPTVQYIILKIIIPVPLLLPLTMHPEMWVDLACPYFRN